MLRQLKIARFKSVRDVTLELGRANLFIGDNGSGKSNLLEAIGLTSACLGRGAGGLDIGARGLRDTPPELMRSAFKRKRLPNTLGLNATFAGGARYEVVLSGSASHPQLQVVSESLEFDEEQKPRQSIREAGAVPLLRPEQFEQDRGIWDQIKADYAVPEDVGRVLDDFAQFVIYTPQSDVLRGRRGGHVEPPPVGLHGEGLADAIPGFLEVYESYRRKKQLNSTEEAEWRILFGCDYVVRFPGWATSFGFHRGEPSLTSRDVADRSRGTAYLTDKYMRTDRSRLSVYESSEGTLMLLFMAMVLAHPEAPRVFALENVGDTLNPGVTRELAEFIIEVVLDANQGDTRFGARQVFMTSNHPTALDAFDLFDDDQRAFSISRGYDGYTKAFRLAPPLGMTREEWKSHAKGRNLSRIWLDGDIPGALSDL